MRMCIKMTSPASTIVNRTILLSGVGKEFRWIWFLMSNERVSPVQPLHPPPRQWAGCFQGPPSSSRAEGGLPALRMRPSPPPHRGASGRGFSDPREQWSGACGAHTGLRLTLPLSVSLSSYLLSSPSPLHLNRRQVHSHPVSWLW